MRCLMATTLNLEVNLCDHCPVFLRVNFATGPGVSEPVNGPLHHLSVTWNKASTNKIANYQAELSRTVNTMLHNVPAEIRECRDCNFRNHLACIDRCASDLHHALFDATEKCIPRIRQQASAACSRLVSGMMNVKNLMDIAYFNISCR